MPCSSVMGLVSWRAIRSFFNPGCDPVGWVVLWAHVSGLSTVRATWQIQIHSLLLCTQWNLTVLNFNVFVLTMIYPSVSVADLHWSIIHYFMFFFHCFHTKQQTRTDNCLIALYTVLQLTTSEWKSANSLWISRLCFPVFAAHNCSMPSLFVSNSVNISSSLLFVSLLNSARSWHKQNTVKCMFYV